MSQPTSPRTAFSFVDDEGAAVADGPADGVVQRINYAFWGQRAALSASLLLTDRARTTLFCSPNSCLRTLTLPRGLRKISARAFFGHPSLTSVNFNAELEEVGPSAFEGCTRLRRVALGGSL